MSAPGSVRRNSIVNGVEPNQQPPSVVAQVHCQRCRDCDDDKTNCQALINGFNLASLAATFIAAIQSQVMSTSLSITPASRAVQAVNALYIGGLILDLMSAFVSFLTARWLQLLLLEEKNHLELCFNARQDERRRRNPVYPGVPSLRNEKGTIPNDATEYPIRKAYDVENSTPGNLQSNLQQQSTDPPRSRFHEYHVKYMALSLFSSFGMLVIGVSSMLVGLGVYVWALQSKVVAALITAVFAGTIPFIIGIFAIGEDGKRRKDVITRLSYMRGDW